MLLDQQLKLIALELSFEFLWSLRDFLLHRFLFLGDWNSCLGHSWIIFRRRRRTFFGSGSINGRLLNFWFAGD